jgi:hypothetical protein
MMDRHDSPRPARAVSQPSFWLLDQSHLAVATGLAKAAKGQYY